MIENSARANEVFSRRYFKRVIEWKGYFLNAYVQGRTPLDFNPEHLMNINVRMIPSESMRNPDLFLSLDYKKYTKFHPLIRTLSTGTPVIFKASLEALGNEWRPHHLHLIEIDKTEEFIDNNHKIILFQGINFNITGHIKIEKEIQQLQVGVEDDVLDKRVEDSNNSIQTKKIDEGIDNAEFNTDSNNSNSTFNIEIIKNDTNNTIDNSDITSSNITNSTSEIKELIKSNTNYDKTIDTNNNTMSNDILSNNAA